MSKQTLAQRFQHLDSLRSAKLWRAREMASMVIPSLLPPEGWTEDQPLPEPYSSEAAKGATSLASRMQSATVPLNDTPFLKFILRNGETPDEQINNLLNTTSNQVYRKLTSGNLRETVYSIYLSLIVVGDVLVEMGDDFNYTLHRLDQYVVCRDMDDTLRELIVIEYHTDTDNNESYWKSVIGGASFVRKGYKTVYCQYVLDSTNNVWKVTKEDAEGKPIGEPDKEYEVLPYAVMRWNVISGENYGRSLVENLSGDIKSIEAFTKSLIDGLAACSTFWMGCHPGGRTEIDDIANAPTGTWVPARREDIFCISPADTMQPQVQTAQMAVSYLRESLARSFLATGAAIPTGDRVTAMAIRTIASELENVLGGAFSSTTRSLWVPMVMRAVIVMFKSGDLNPQLQEHFFGNDGTLKIQILTGLQALNRDTELSKLLQMGEMVRNLPPEAQRRFKWSEYAKALVTAIGFDNTKWVMTDEELAEQEKLLRQNQLQAAVAQKAIEVGGNAAAQDIEQTGGQNVASLIGETNGNTI